MDKNQLDDDGSGNESASEEAGSSFFEASRDAVIFLLDATSSMFETKYESPTIRMALECTLNMFKTKIITSDYDYMGIVLFGTKDPKAPKDIGDYPNTYVLRDLQRPDVEIVKELDTIVKDEDGYNGLRDLTTDPPVYALADALWLCNSMFSKRCKGRETKRLFIFTDNDDPYFNNAALKKQAERRASDLRDGNVDLVLFPLSPNFDVNKFFKEILYEGDGTTGIVPVGSIEDLLDKVKRRVHKKRTTGKLLFDLGKDVKFSVGLYNLVRPAPNPKREMLDSRTNEQVKSQTTRFNALTGEVLLGSELTKYTEFRSEKIQMDPLDIKRIKSMYTPGFKLLGFKPVDQIKANYYHSASSFIHPDEEVVKGSKSLFGCLLERCAARGVVPICRFIANHARSPRMVALLPQLEERSPFGEQLKPPGFHVFYLPFADDFRPLPCREFVGPVPSEEVESATIWKANDEQVEVAKAVVDKLTSNNFSVEQVPDPSLHKKWGVVEAAALVSDFTREFKDHTLPNETKIIKKLGQTEEAFLSLVYPTDYNPEESVSKATGSRGSRVAAKKELANVDVEAEVKAGRVKKLTVDILKHFLQNKGVSHLSGKRKDELIELTLKHCDSD